MSRYNAIITAHAVLATAAFAFFFPLGGILIRLGNFPRLWLIHGIFQMFAYLIYIAAFGLGIYMTANTPMMSERHPIIGVIVLLLVLFQPLLGFVHHLAFKKHSKRVVWSYAHIWLGRIAITLGIINGGLGLELSKKTRFSAPSQGAVIGYSVVAGLMWLAYVASVIYGERKRSRQAAVHQNAPPAEPKAERRGDDSMEMQTRYA